MKEIIIGLIIAAAIYKFVEITIDFIQDIKKGKDWDNLKKEVFEFIHECSNECIKPEFIGFKDECMIFQYYFNMNDERKLKMLEYSTSAYFYGRKIEWTEENSRNVIKISL